MNREQNFRQVVKITRATDEPPLGTEIETYGDARRDAILWADEEITRLQDMVRTCRKSMRALDEGGYLEQSWPDFCADTERLIQGNKAAEQQPTIERLQAKLANDYLAEPRQQRAEIERLKNKLYTQSVKNRNRNERYAADWRAEINAGTRENVEQQAEIERLRAIVDKLPKTADGVPIVPAMKVWGYHHIRGLIEGTVRSDLSIIGEWNGIGYPILNHKDSYSTREAAERREEKL